MKMSVYKMYPKDKFAVVTFKTGDLYIDEIIRINKAYKEDKDYSSIHFLVMVFLDCNPIFNEKDLENLAQEYSKNEQPNNHIRSVFLVDGPKTTAFAHLMHTNTPEHSFYCSTYEKAYEFLCPGISFSDFVDKIKTTQ
jgi:hypothetical protein